MSNKLSSTNRKQYIFITSALCFCNMHFNMGTYLYDFNKFSSIPDEMKREEGHYLMVVK